MALRGVKRMDPQNPGPCEVIETCPVCGGRMESVYSRPHEDVCACIDCQTMITVPVIAWHIAQVKKKPRALKK
jgi:hypothetical protein